MPKAVREKWQPLINSFLTGSEPLAGVVQLIDMRHGPTKEDLRSIDYLAELQLPTLIVFTKADKLTPTERRKAMERLPERLGVEPDQTLAVSALSGDGIEELLASLGALLS